MPFSTCAPDYVCLCVSVCAPDSSGFNSRQRKLKIASSTGINSSLSALARCLVCLFCWPLNGTHSSRVIATPSTVSQLGLFFVSVTVSQTVTKWRTQLVISALMESSIVIAVFAAHRTRRFLDINRSQMTTNVVLVLRVLGVM